MSTYLFFCLSIYLIVEIRSPHNPVGNSEKEKEDKVVDPHSFLHSPYYLSSDLRGSFLFLIRSSSFSPRAYLQQILVKDLKHPAPVSRSLQRLHRPQ